MQVAPNLDYIKNLSGDDSVFEQKFIGILKDEFPVELRAYRNCIERQELTMASEIVHKLKHKFNILSMTDAYEFAVRYEEELLKGNMKGDSDFYQFLNIIENYLNTI